MVAGPLAALCQGGVIMAVRSIISAPRRTSSHRTPGALVPGAVTARQSVMASKQGLLARGRFGAVANRLGHAARVDAQHCRNVVQVVPGAPKQIGGFDFVGRKCLAMYVDAVKNHPRHGVGECSHVDLHMAAGGVVVCFHSAPCGAALSWCGAVSHGADDGESSAPIAHFVTPFACGNPINCGHLRGNRQNLDFQNAGRLTCVAGGASAWPPQLPHCEAGARDRHSPCSKAASGPVGAFYSLFTAVCSSRSGRGSDRGRGCGVTRPRSSVLLSRVLSGGISCRGVILWGRDAGRVALNFVTASL